ncbi:hypothetical protein, partial [Porphyromonas levii]|uniref:hypothetical protein n=1 Tax=Porphyromonas levii TaxID=28114 RepID=UPI001BAD27E9
ASRCGRSPDRNLGLYDYMGVSHAILGAEVLQSHTLAYLSNNNHSVENGTIIISSIRLSHKIWLSL